MQAIICDLDNTLYDENIFIESVCYAFCARYGLDSSLVAPILADDFRLSSKDIFGDWLKSFDFYTKSRQEELFNLYQSHPAKLHLYEDAHAFLAYAKERGLKIGILTNGSLQAQAHKVKLLGLDKSAHIAIEYARAEGAAYEKPHINAYKRILQKLGVESSACAFIGDNPRTDILGANNAGLYSIWLKRGYARLMPCDFAHVEVEHFAQAQAFIESRF